MHIKQFVLGAHGVDFSSFKNKDFQNTKDIEEGVITVAKHLLEHGVTAFCPTIVTSTPDYYKKVSGCKLDRFKLVTYIRFCQLSHRQ